MPSVWLVWIDHSRAVRLSIWAPTSAPLTDNEAEARSAPRPTRTADRATGAPAGTWPSAPGAMVRTMGGAATAAGDARGDGLGARPGDGADAERLCNPSLAVSVGGTPAGVRTSLPGTAPLKGRSFAGPQLARASASVAAPANATSLS